jgi:hypothetical protein
MPETCAGAEVCKVIDLVFVQRDAAAEVDLDLIRSDDAPDELCAGAAHSLVHGEDRWNCISGARVVFREIGVVEV